MKSFIFFVLGIYCCTFGLFFTLLYCNLFLFGYTFGNFVYFIIRRGECIIFLLGIVFLYLSTKRKG